MENSNSSDDKSELDALILYHHCSSDNHNARNKAYQQLGEFLLRIVLSRLRTRPHSTQLAEDCVQQALFAIWQQLKQGNGPARPELFLTWSAAIAIHKLIDELRKLGRHSFDSLDDSAGEEERSYTHRAEADAPESSALNSETKHELLTLILEHPHLSEDVKLVLVQGYFYDRSDSELADHLCKARATVRVLRFRGLETLRKDPSFLERWHL